MPRLNLMVRNFVRAAAICTLASLAGTGPLSAVQPTDEKPKVAQKTEDKSQTSKPEQATRDDSDSGASDDKMDPGTEEQFPQARESALVRAARSRGTAPGKARITMTNESVKKSTGKLTIISSSKELPKVDQKPPEVAKPAQPPTEGEPSGNESKTSALVAAADSGRRLEKAKRDVDELERELNRLEQEYYAEDDPGFRDQVIRPRFERVKIQLERAREALLSAREDQSRAH